MRSGKSSWISPTEWNPAVRTMVRSRRGCDITLTDPHNRSPKKEVFALKRVP